MHVQRWGILWSAMPCNMFIGKVIATVRSLAKLHNYCIDVSEISEDMPQSLERDTNNVMNKQDGYVKFLHDSKHNTAMPIDLMYGGHHFDDIPLNILKAHYSMNEQDILPWTTIHNFIAKGHWERPCNRKRKSMD